MASILGLSIEALKEVCKEAGSEIANLNCPGQVVLSGTKDAIKNAMALSEKKGAKKAMLLNVSGPFHSSLMKEAGEFLRVELNKVQIKNPQIPVVSNVTSDYESSPEEIKENLVKQLYSPVRWEDSVRRIAGDGCSVFYEIGPGKVLKGLLGRIDEKLEVKNIEKMGDVESL
jgi:[acyl-carrier-protein] S-malonyltransferase